MTLVTYVLLCRYCASPADVTVQTRLPQETEHPGSCMQKFKVRVTTVTKPPLILTLILNQSCESQGLLLGECGAALVAGVNLMQLAGTTAVICQLQALSASGRCRTFDVAADGYGRGEGVAVMLLRPSGAGGSSGLPIMVAGSAVNQVKQLTRACCWTLMRACH